MKGGAGTGSSAFMPLAIVALALIGVAFAWGGGYAPFVVALVALTTTVGVGLNILLGLAGQISLGHVGFYAIGAYTVSISTLHGVSFWIALPMAGGLSGAIGLVLALPALRVSGPYLAMITIAFVFIVQHGIIEWRDLTGGANGLVGLEAPAIGSIQLAEREMAILAVALAGLSLYLFHRLAGSGWGRAMIAVRDAEVAARSIGLNPVTVKTAAFTLSAALTGSAGAIFAPLMMFVAPDSFPFSQSILFLMAVIVGGAGWVLGPVVGAVVTVLLPEMLSGLAEYRLLFFGATLLVVLWIAPDGIIGTFARLVGRPDPREADAGKVDLLSFLAPAGTAAPLAIRGVGIAFGGVKAATDVSFVAAPGQITSVIGPNGAGKTTVLNMVSGFYKPDTGNIAIAGTELAGVSAWKIARAGIARTYQTTKLFSTMSVLDNVAIGLRRGRLGGMLAPAATAEDRRAATTLLAFVGYQGALAVPARDLPHVDRRLVEIARALATRPRVLLLDEPAAGLMRADKDALGRLLRRIADLGVAVVLVEHDMAMVMTISDHVVVLDAGQVIAAGTAAEVRVNQAVQKAYLGEDGIEIPGRPTPWGGVRDALLNVRALQAGYGAAPVLSDITMCVHSGEAVAVLGANGAGKSTLMAALSGILRPVKGVVEFSGVGIGDRAADEVVRAGVILVPEGRQVFPELNVRDNLLMGAFTRSSVDPAAEIALLVQRFPRLGERLDQRAGLLSGGEQQMLAIARGLIAGPRILLLDEPSLGLAPQIVNALYGQLAALRDEGMTILLVDQMATLALAVVDRAYVLQSGLIAREAPASALRADPDLARAYLGGSSEDPREVPAGRLRASVAKELA